MNCNENPDSSALRLLANLRLKRQAPQSQEAIYTDLHIKVPILELDHPLGDAIDIGISRSQYSRVPK
jgi:hypothetical protein